jgi:hypothetical protein
MYPAVLMYFISVAFILQASLALIVQVSLPYNEEMTTESSNLVLIVRLGLSTFSEVFCQGATIAPCSLSAGRLNPMKELRPIVYEANSSNLLA